MNRRSFLLGLSSTMAAPAIVRAASLMPVRGIIMDAKPAWPQEAVYFADRMVWIEPGTSVVHFSARLDFGAEYAYDGARTTWTEVIDSSNH